MGIRLIKVQLFLGVLLLWTKVGSHPVHPMTLYYHQQGQQNEGIIMSPESESPAEDRMDSSAPEEEEDDMSSSSSLISTFTFPLPPPQMMPNFNPNPIVHEATRRMTRTASPSEYPLPQQQQQLFWNFAPPPQQPLAADNYNIMPLTFSAPPFIIPEYASLPTSTPPPLQQYQFQSQPISYQFPILDNNVYHQFNLNNFQFQPSVQQGAPPPQAPPNFQEPPPPQFTWQAQPLSPEMEAAIMQQFQPPPPPQTQYPSQQIVPQTMTSSPISHNAPTPPQLEDYSGAQSTTTATTTAPMSMSSPPPTTTTQLPFIQPKPELMSTTTPIPGTTTTKPSFGGLYSNNDGSSSSYAASYGNYTKGIIPIEKFEHVITKDGYNVTFKSANGIESMEEGHLKVVQLKKDKNEESSSVGYNNEKSDTSSTMGVVHVKSGKVTWTSPECATFTLRYVADENGYRPNIQQSTASTIECMKYGQKFGKMYEIVNTNALGVGYGGPSTSSPK